MAAISFFAPGIPRPGGSKKGFYIQKIKRVVITEDNKRSKDWRAVVAQTAHDAIGEPLLGPLAVRFEFVLPRPAGHYGSGKNAGSVRSSAPLFPTTKPDITKLIRSTEDAMKGIAWMDDAQIVTQIGTKRYGRLPGVWITIMPAQETTEPEQLNSLDLFSATAG